ncbi:MAG: hypothetical protein CMP23_01470 [Rickettsiales bacterium]|nr:hypothetical protein [Rickettsiales bacterium]
MLLGYTAMLLLFGGVMTAALYEMRSTQASLASLSAGYLPLSRELVGARSWPLGLELQPDQQPERLMRVRNAELFVIQRMDAQLQRAAQMAQAMEDSELEATGSLEVVGLSFELEECRELLAQYRQQHDRFVQLMEAGGQGSEQSVEELVALRKAIEQRLKKLGRNVARLLSEVVSNTERSQRDALLAMVGLSIVAFILSLLLLVSTNFILRPIRQLIISAERIGEGKLDERVSVESRDEVARLASAFNAMADSLQEREGRLEERSRQLEQAVTDLQESQEALIRSERLATIGQMAAQIAHEVRNPLNALGLNAELLADDLDSGESDSAQALLVGIRAEVARLTRITEDYLNLGRLPPLSLQPHSLETLIDELISFQGADLSASGVEVQCDWPVELPQVEIDAAQLRQALLNIVRNAAEALVGGGGVLRLSAEPQDQGVCLRIEDDGPGMDPELVARVFDPFFSTKEQGSGLGLPLTQQVIEEHGGRIRCTSRVGDGTTFTIWLPAVQPASSHSTGEVAP